MAFRSQRRLFMVVASILAFAVVPAILRPPPRAGGLYRGAVWTALAASIAVLLLAGSGLPFRRRNWMRLLKGAMWASLMALLFINAAVVRVVGMPGLFSDGVLGLAALISIAMAILLVAGDVYEIDV